MKLKGHPTPVKPTVVGDRLFTNTSKRWISTANLREDMMLMKSYNYLDAAKRTTGQAHDYNMQVFRDIWSRKLDRSKLTKRPEKKKEDKKKKEIASYLRDVYSESESEEETDEFNQSVSTIRKRGRKKIKKTVSGFSGLDGDVLAEEDEDDLSSRGLASPLGSPFVMSSLASLSRYMPDEPPTPEPEPLGKERPVKSAGEIKMARDDVPPLRRKVSRSTSAIRPRRSLLEFTPVNGSATPAGGATSRAIKGGEPSGSEQLTIPTITETRDDVKTPDDVSGDVSGDVAVGDDVTEGARDADAATGSDSKADVGVHMSNSLAQLTVKGNDSPTASSILSVNTVDSASYDLSRLKLAPRAFPPIYTMKPRKPEVRPWDYPFAGVGSRSPDLEDEEKPAAGAGEKLHEQLADLRYCRYLRLPPSKQAKRRMEQQQMRARRKETVYVVAAGREINVDKRIFSVPTETAAGKWMRKIGIPLRPAVKPAIIEVKKEEAG